MFKKAASDALGLSDIGKIISPADYGQTEADDFVMSEEGEQIFFVIKSKSDEYCFTNLAMIHVDGTTAMSKKRLVKRFDYYQHHIRNVLLETAGTMDMDVEIKFQFGDTHYSIDVAKNQILELKKLYKALLRIGHLQSDNQRMMQYANTSIDKAIASVGRATMTSSALEQVQGINQYAFEWLQNAYDRYNQRDFGDIFATFVKPTAPAEEED
ncbi:MAG TPA: PH domain-containing protein [Anaerolineae bacterium]|nr:PH domain-containing protein [Anaerolineae bacterium]